MDGGTDGPEAKMSQERELHTRSTPTLSARAPRLHLTAGAGHDAVFAETTQPVTLIGSRRDCDLFIGHSDVSKIHCALVNTGVSIIATDLCSRSGTFVNGQQISIATLHPEDELRVGSELVEVRFLEPEDDSARLATRENEADDTLTGVLRLTAAEQQYELTKLPAVIGRRHICRIVLDTPDVSLAHALLFTIEGQPAIYDLGSRSGTYLNGERVMLAWLHDGDQLCIGGEDLSLTWDRSQPAPSEVISTDVVAESAAAATDDEATTPQQDILEDLGPEVVQFDTELNESEEIEQEHCDALNLREAELERQLAILHEEQARLVLEKQQTELQATELRAAVSKLEQDRAHFEARRARFERERIQLDPQRVELKQKLARHEAITSELQTREVALDERLAALAAGEREHTRKRAELAQREAECAEAAKRVMQFMHALSEAWRVFGFGDVPSSQLTESGPRPAATVEPASAPKSSSSEMPGDPSPSADLPAPLVDKALFPDIGRTPPA